MASIRRKARLLSGRTPTSRSGTRSGRSAFRRSCCTTAPTTRPMKASPSRAGRSPPWCAAGSWCATASWSAPKAPATMWRARSRRSRRHSGERHRSSFGAYPFGKPASTFPGYALGSLRPRHLVLRRIEHQARGRLDPHEMVAYLFDARHILRRHHEGLAFALVGDGAPQFDDAVAHDHVDARRPRLAFELGQEPVA